MSQKYHHPDDPRLWRFGIISPLLHRDGDSPPLAAMIAELAEHTWYTPGGVPRRYCADTLRDWFERYRQSGIDGLHNKTRKDRGASSIPEALTTALADVRKSQPDWTLTRLLRELVRGGNWDGHTPSRSTLYRYASAAGLARGAAQPVQPVRSFAYPFFGDLWTGDFLHGPKVRVGTHQRKAYLHAIIDDATRYSVVGRFHLAEDTRALLDDLMLAIRKFGIPKRLYTDNGAAFRSRHVRMVAARLGIAMPHTPAYRPQGRGKVERFFRTVRDSFLAGRPPTSLDRLNQDLAAWVNTYHATMHAGLGMSPLSRKLEDRGPALRFLPATQDINQLFRMEHSARIGRDGCVRLFSRRYQIPDALPGMAITVYYLPWDQEHVYLGDTLQPIKPLDTTANAVRFDRPRRGKFSSTTKDSHHEKNQ